MQEAIAKIEREAKAQGKFLGTIAPDWAGAKKLYDKGYSLVYFMSDTTTLSAAAHSAVETFRQDCGQD